MEGAQEPIVRGEVSARSSRTVQDVVAFTAVAALFAIGADAAIGHAMLWGNDPYWSYWITDTLLMATVFGLGTAWFGIGVGRGAVLTAVHIVLLTTYYWSLAPIGLPGQPEWLDLQRTWVTGIPVHFGVYFLGYVVAVWLWRRLRSRQAHYGGLPRESAASLATRALVTAVGIVVVAGLLQTVLFGDFPGVTWFVMRIAIASPFTLAWWATAGRDRAAVVSGGVALGLLLTAYTHFLAPIGLPNSAFRFLAENSPPAAVHWLSYQQEFLVVLPLTMVLAVLAYFLALRPPAAKGRWSRRATVASVVAAAVLLVVGAVGVPFTGPAAASADLTANSGAKIGHDPANDAALAAGTASIRLHAEDKNIHRTPLPPHDVVDLTADVTGLDGIVYSVRATQPMVAEPRGLFTTWEGVGFQVWHHGRSGIGYVPLPPTLSEVAVYALGTVSVGDTPIATGVPVHVLTADRDGARLELHVGDGIVPVAGLPDGYLRVAWSSYDGGHSPAINYARYALGGTLLIVLLIFAVAGAARESPRPFAREVR